MTHNKITTNSSLRKIHLGAMRGDHYSMLEKMNVAIGGHGSELRRHRLLSEGHQLVLPSSPGNEEEEEMAIVAAIDHATSLDFNNEEDYNDNVHSGNGSDGSIGVAVGGG